MKLSIRCFSTLLVLVFALTIIFNNCCVINVNATNEEGETYGRGAIPMDWSVVLEHLEPVNEQQMNGNLTVNSTQSTLPSSVDLSTSDYFPPIRSQGNINACTAFATTYYQFTYEVAKLNNLDAKHNEDYQFSPKYVYNYLNQGRNNGLAPEVAYDFLVQQGSVKWQEFLYNGTATVPENYLAWCNNTSAMKAALKTRIRSWDAKAIYANLTDSPTITSYNDTDLNEIKSLLNEGKVLVASSTFCFDDTDESNGDDDYIVDNTAGKKTIIKNVASNEGHCVAIVGYDDNVSYDLNGDGTIQNYEKGALKIANSWGTGWANGNNGFIWVMYDALNKHSNVSALDSTDRRPMFDLGTENINLFLYINVANYDNLVTAEINLRAKTRKNVQVNLVDTFDKLEYNLKNTFLNYIGGSYSFAGTTPAYSNATFVFDYNAENSLPNTTNPTKYFSIQGITANNESMTISSSKIVDDAGNVIATGSSGIPVNSPDYTTTLEIGSIKFADVDYSGTVDMADVELVRAYVTNTTTLSKLQLKLADVNGDGVVSIVDVANIRSMIAE